VAAAAEWRRRVRQWRSSGESSREFAAKIGCNPRTLTWWASRLRRSARSPGQALDLVRVISAPPEEPPVGGPVEIMLVRGYVVRVGRGFDAVALRAVIATLEGR